MTQQIEQLLSDVSFKIGTLREARNRFADQLAPEFRIFDYLRNDEMGLSRCIANLLNPKGEHGQGSIFLDAFLKKILDDESSWQTNAKDFLAVALEKQANGRCRIDIYLEFKNGIIGIENKPWASDQDKQLTDYATYLEKTAGNKNWLLVFLSKRSPYEASLTSTRQEELENAGQFVHCDFGVVIDWLKICACKTKAPVVRVFIEELSKFIRTYINGEVEMSDAIEIKNAVLKSQETLDSAFQIYKAMYDVKMELFEKLHRDLEIGLEENGLKLTDWEFNGWRPCSGFNVQFCKEEQNLYLRFEFEKSESNEFFWGIGRKKGLYNNDIVWKNVNDLMNSEFDVMKIGSRFPWYAYCPNQCFDNEMKDWSISAKPWLMIKDGSLASQIIELANRVYNAFEPNNNLHLLCED